MRNGVLSVIALAWWVFSVLASAVAMTMPPATGAVVSTSTLIAGAGRAAALVSFAARGSLDSLIWIVALWACAQAVDRLPVTHGVVRWAVLVVLVVGVASGLTGVVELWELLGRALAARPIWDLEDLQEGAYGHVGAALVWGGTLRVWIATRRTIPRPTERL
jgi:hypothetical protein